MKLTENNSKQARTHIILVLKYEYESRWIVKLVVMVFKCNAPNYFSGYKSNDNTGIHIFDFPDKEKEPEANTLAFEGTS